MLTGGKREQTHLLRLQPCYTYLTQEVRPVSDTQLLKSSTTLSARNEKMASKRVNSNEACTVSHCYKYKGLVPSPLPPPLPLAAFFPGDEEYTNDWHENNCVQNLPKQRARGRPKTKERKDRLEKKPGATTQQSARHAEPQGLLGSARARNKPGRGGNNRGSGLR